MNDPVLEQELIAQHSPTEGDGHGEVPHDAEDAHHGAEDAHGEEPNASTVLRMRTVRSRTHSNSSSARSGITAKSR